MQWAPRMPRAPAAACHAGVGVLKRGKRLTISISEPNADQDQQLIPSPSTVANPAAIGGWEPAGPERTAIGAC